MHFSLTFLVLRGIYQKYIVEMMEDRVYTVRLNDSQVAEVQALLRSRGWGVDLEPIERYREKEDIAGEYVGIKSPFKPETEKEDSSPDVPRRRTKSEPECKEASIVPQNDERLEAMKKIGESYKQSFKGAFRAGSVKEVPAKSQGPWRLSLTPGSDINNQKIPNSDIVFSHFLVADETKIKVITRLTTEHVHNVSRVPVRIVLLVDRSGSMLHKIGRDSRHTKITKVKHFAKKLIASLDEGDEAGLVTFGEDAQVFFPLEKLTEKSRPLLLNRLETLDRGSMSRETNLSAGLRMALKVFFEASTGAADYLERKNSILVFSDGEINAGTTETNSLLHEVRQNIRQMVPKLDETQNQWVTISVVTTGSCVSEQAYMLSKTCSSEAYYYINKDSEDPEADLFLPVLLRKTAVAWNISFVIEAFHGVTFDDKRCSRDNRVRMRRSISGHANAEKAYFMYDFAASHSRQIGVEACWQGERSVAHLPNDEVFFKLRVEFTNIKGERLWQEQMITKEDIIDACHDQTDKAANAAACKHELQLMSSDVLHSAAEHVKRGDKAKSKAVMADGQKSLRALLEEFGEKSSQEPSDDNRIEISMYAKCVVDNLSALISTIEKSTDGESWNKMKAVSTAIVREAPNISDTVVDADILCPLPDIHNMGTSSMNDPLQHLMAKNKKQKRVTIGLEQLLEEMQMSSKFQTLKEDLYC